MFINRSLAPQLFILMLLIIGASFTNCTPEEEILDLDFEKGLLFSTDTVLFDTVFTGMGSATKRLKVYNPNKNALKINSISLGLGQNSSYNVLINGTEPSSSEELIILGKDSILILVEVYINPQNANNPYLVKDSVVFETNDQIQDVKLIAWGQDAVYLGNEIIPCNTTWTSEKPYVVYSSILIDSLCELNIEKGTRIFASKNSSIFVRGKIVAEGTHKDRIYFRNDRLDPAFDDLHGQWGGIYLLEGSHENLMDFVTIRNGEYGIRLGSPDPDTIPDIVLKNVIIENMSRSGILSFTSDIYAENVLVNNCIELNFGGIAGGNYNFRHCTFANYSFNIIRGTPQFFASDRLVLDDNSTIVENLFIEITNSMIEGNLEDELIFELSGETDSRFSFTNSIFRTTISGLDTLGNMLNVDPKFVDPLRYNYRLDTLSPAKDAGGITNISTDLDGNLRDDLPDIGAYERIE